MKWKIHPLKRWNMIVIYSLFGAAGIYNAVFNSLEVAQAELLKFYEDGLNNCEVTSIYEKDYKGGRGTYKLFATDCSEIEYPISLPTQPNAKESIKKGSIITKDPNSFEIIIRNDKNELTAIIQDYKKLDDRPVSLIIIGIMLCLATILFILVPNSRYEKIAQNIR